MTASMRARDDTESHRADCIAPRVSRVPPLIILTLASLIFFVYAEYFLSSLKLVPDLPSYSTLQFSFSSQSNPTGINDSGSIRNHRDWNITPSSPLLTCFHDDENTTSHTAHLQWSCDERQDREQCARLIPTPTHCVGQHTDAWQVCMSLLIH